MNRGGAENAIMNYYREIDRSKVQFDFLITDSRKSDFEDEILSLGGKVYRVRLLTIKHPMRYISDVKSFFKTHPEYQIVHSHTSSKSVIPLAIAKYYKIPIRIAHSHNAKTESGMSGKIRDCLKPFLKYIANVFFSCGEQASQWLYGKKFNKRRQVSIIHNVIDANKFRFNVERRREIREQLSIDKETIVIGNVARFSIQKNHRFSLMILKEFLALYPKSKLLLIGDGQEKENIIKYAKELGILENLIMVGAIPNVYDFLQAMDVFILPSLFEGLPLSIIEAQVSGLPCYTTLGTVSSECSVTELVNYLPLESGAAHWAEEIYKTVSSDYNRTDRYEEIKSAGYDSVTTANTLQDLYINLAKSFIESRSC